MSEFDKPTADHLVVGEEEVLHYLLQHPDFFMRQAPHIEKMRIPHPVRGAVSLVEWQLARQRQSIERLESEILLLMDNARENEGLLTQFFTLQYKLMAAGSVQILLETLQHWARSMGLLNVSVHLFSEKWHLDPPSSFLYLALSQQQFLPFRICKMGEERHYLGTLSDSELAQWLPGEHSVGSVTLSVLGEQGDLGLLIFSSRDHRHYHANMGTLLLNHLSKVLPILLMRWITLK